jgi:hypothetical protein
MRSVIIAALLVATTTCAGWAQQRGPAKPDDMAWIEAELARVAVEIRQVRQVYIEARLKQLRAQGADDDEAARTIERELAR